MSQKRLFQLGGVGLGVPLGRNPALVNQSYLNACRTSLEVT
jgi:hypothetical protein